MRGWLFASLMIAAFNATADCQDATEALQSMAGATLVLKGPDARSMELEVRVADDNNERAAGFQHICPGTVDSTNIFFQFQRPRATSFHMRNVKAPLDIAFINEAGVIVEIQRMEPYVLGAARTPTYPTPGPVAAALETRAGYFDENDITAGNWKIEMPEQ